VQSSSTVIIEKPDFLFLVRDHLHEIDHPFAFLFAESKERKQIGVFKGGE